MEEANKNKPNKKGGKGGKKGWSAKAGIVSGLLGKKGVIATCDLKREKRCTDELLALFHEYAELLYPNKVLDEVGADDDNSNNNDSNNNNKEQETTKEISVEDAIKMEVESLKNKRKAHMLSFQPYDTGVSCLVFIAFNEPDIDPLPFLTKIFTDIIETKVIKARFTNRLVPVEITCAGNLSEISRVAKKLITPVFNAGDAPKTYKIMVSHRHNSSIKQKETIDAIAAMVDRANRADLHNPEYGIVVEVIKQTACVSVIGDFMKWHNFSLRKMAGLEPAPQGPGGCKEKRVQEQKAKHEASIQIAAGKRKNREEGEGTGEGAVGGEGHKESADTYDTTSNNEDNNNVSNNDNKPDESTNNAIENGNKEEATEVAMTTAAESNSTDNSSNNNNNDEQQQQQPDQEQQQQPQQQEDDFGITLFSQPAKKKQKKKKQQQQQQQQ